VIVLTSVFDEEDLLPHHLAHYWSQGATRIIVLDNGSTDSTLDIARRMGAEVSPWYSDGMDDQGMRDALWARRNTLPEGWCVIADADEFLIPREPGRTLAEVLKDHCGHRILAGWWWEIVDRHGPGDTLVERYRWGIPVDNEQPGKFTIFHSSWQGRPGIGLHRLESGETPRANPFLTLHFSAHNRAVYMKRRRKMVARQNERNYSKGHSFHYWKKSDADLLRAYRDLQESPKIRRWDGGKK
jgi:glycosyltransferase involved in cell wall biosynthesis